MALNLATFKTRTISAAVFAAVMLTGLCVNEWTFFILFSIIHAGCWMEYQKLIGKILPDYNRIGSFHRYGIILAGWCILLYFTSDLVGIMGLPFHALGWWLGLLLAFTLPLIEILFSGSVRLTNIGLSLAGICYISLPWGLMVDIRSIPAGHKMISSGGAYPGYLLPLLLVFSIWVNDTMAYIVGSLIGRTPFSRVSPKKTWEGTLGGVVLCVAIMGWLGNRMGLEWGDAVFISFTAAVAGTAGDLLESKLKRMAGVKDSGNMMPGHGGFLDRFDSMLVAIPFVWLYIRLFMLPA